MSRVTRKKVNFMIDKDILVKFHAQIPEGKRSDFVNEAIENCLTLYGRKEARKFIDQIAQKSQVSGDDYLIEKEYGRE